MSIHMATTIQEERLRWVLPIVTKEMRLIDVARICPYGKRSLERWVAAYRKGRSDGLIPRSTRQRSEPGEKPLHINERTIGKIIKAEGLVRKYRVKKVKTKYVKVPLLPGELLEIDVKYVPESIEDKPYFQYTAIDCASRWRYLEAYDEQSTFHSIQFLKRVIAVFGYRIRAVKTDNGSVFTN